MGISIDVHSIVYTPPYPPIAPHTIAEAQWYAERWGLLALICETFGWRRIPWEEPSTYHSPDGDSCSEVRYRLLREVARAAALDLPLVEAERAWGAYRDHAPPQFRHLITRDDSGYIALYVPLDLPAPVAIRSTSWWETFTVGSAPLLKQDVDAIAQRIRRHTQEQGAEATSGLRMGQVAYSWPSLEELCGVLGRYAQEACDHGVPMFLSW